jgi:hypothetical protein
VSWWKARWGTASATVHEQVPTEHALSSSDRPGVRIQGGEGTSTSCIAQPSASHSTFIVSIGSIVAARRAGR